MSIIDTLTTPRFRQWLYGVITIAVPILVSYGIVDAEQVALWLALGAAVLGTGTATVSVARQRSAGVLPASQPRKRRRKTARKPQVVTTDDLRDG